MESSRFFALLPSIALLVSPLSAFADTEYCVGTSSGLRDALVDAAADGDDSLVKIRSGTITMALDAVYRPGAESVLPAGRLTIRGGYNSDCSAYSTTAGATRLVSTNGSRLQATTLTGDVTVAGLTFDGTHLTMTSTAGSYCPGSRRLFSLSSVRITGAGFRGTGWCHNLKIVNSLFASPVAVPDSGLAADTAVGIDLAYNEEGFGSASRLTMVNSTITGGRLEIRGDAAAPGIASLYNSIFSRAAGADIFSSARVLARNNRFDGISFTGSGFLLGDSGENTSAGAQLDANFVPQPGSPAVNSGTSAVPDGLAEVDHTGNDRVIGARPDMGALESPVDGTGVYTVTNANASGSGSLAWALDLANSDAGFNRIRFSIPGSCPKRITPGGPLQVRESVAFDGFSQPGTLTNTAEVGFNGAPCIVLNGGATRGIGIETTSALSTNSGYVSVKGIAFENYDVAISLAFGTRHRIEGSQFGGLVPASGGGSAITLAGNGRAISIIGGTDTTIGGSSPSQRNLIGSSGEMGVQITQFLGAGGNGNRIVNNVIGLDRNGAFALPNATGIVITGGGNEVAENYIAGNTVDGIRLAGSNARGNVVADNLIGGTAGSLSLITPNGRMGVMIENGAWENEIGPGNTIARNGDDGVRVYSDAGGRNRINGNVIALNTAMGIDLGSNGVSANDPDPLFCSGDGGCIANRGQNFPLIASATRVRSGAFPVGRPVNIRGTLRSTIGSYRIEVFGNASCDANGYGEGRRLLGAIEMTIPNAAYCPTPGGACLACSEGNCTRDFSVWIPELDVTPGDAISATATSAVGDTSEFAACRALVDEADNDLIFANGFEN